VPSEHVRLSPPNTEDGMRNRIRILALTVVAIGGGALVDPRAAHATYNPPPPPMHCCCQVELGVCVTRCCSPAGCTATPDGCRIGTT
jgi:hypothetical protein